MDGWMDGWLVGWMDVCMNGWLVGWLVAPEVRNGTKEWSPAFFTICLILSCASMIFVMPNPLSMRALVTSSGLSAVPCSVTMAGEVPAILAKICMAICMGFGGSFSSTSGTNAEAGLDISSSQDAKNKSLPPSKRISDAPHPESFVAVYFSLLESLYIFAEESCCGLFWEREGSWRRGAGGGISEINSGD